MLKALIVCAGKSLRMGEDKSLINYHGLPQYQHCIAMVKAANLKPYLSCRYEQKKIISEHTKLYDQTPNRGPISALMAAFQEDPNSAWLVLACDMPKITLREINALIEKRSVEHSATVAIDSNKFMQPLFAIYEPQSLKIISKKVLKSEYSIMSNLKSMGEQVKKVFFSNEVLLNVNSKEDLI